MVKMVLIDFYLRRGQALKKAWTSSFFSIWPIILSQSSIWINESEHNTQICWIWCIFFALFTLLIHEMYPATIPEAMRFVPMNKEEKKKYLSCMLGVKVGGIFILQFFVGVILVCLKICVWWQVCLIISATTLWSGVCGVLGGMTSCQKKKEELVYHGAYAGRRIIVHILALCNLIIMPFIHETTIQLWEIIIFFVSYTLQIILSGYLIKKAFPLMLEQGMSYE